MTHYRAARPPRRPLAALSSPISKVESAAADPRRLLFAEPKTGSSRRTVQVGTSAIAALRAHRVRQTAERLRAGSAWEDPDIVVASEAGTPLDAGNVLRRAFRRTLTRAKLPLLPFHALRHTSVTRRNHPRTVADRLGHATPSLVMNVYGHVTDRMQAEATAALERVLGA